jgi:hypothetical protein
LTSNFKAENVKLAADIPSSLTSQLTSKFRAENQKLAEELTVKFQSETVNLREELSQKFQNEVTNMSQDFSALRNDTDKELQQVKVTIEGISDNLHEKINAHIVDTRKGIERIAHEVNATSKSLTEEIQKYKDDTESEVISVRQDFSKFSEEITADHARWQLTAGTNIEKVSSSMKGMEEKVADFQVAVERKKSEFHKVNLEINSLKVKLAAASEVTGRSADCNVVELQAAGDRNDQLNLNPLA